MGYELHITRAPDWAKSEELPISQEEWERYARQDARLREEGMVSWTDIGDQPVFVLGGRDDIEACLSWREDCIDVWGMSDEAIRAGPSPDRRCVRCPAGRRRGERYRLGGDPGRPEKPSDSVSTRILLWRNLLKRLAGRAFQAVLESFALPSPADPRGRGPSWRHRDSVMRKVILRVCGLEPSA